MPAQDPVVSGMFCLEIQGLEQAMFREGSGFNSETEIIESREVGPRGVAVIKKIPGAVKWDNITLRRGITGSKALWDWRRDVIEGGVDQARKDGSIVIYDQNYDEVARFNFFRGWPSTWKGADLKADENAVAVEELVITHEGLERVI